MKILFNYKGIEIILMFNNTKVVKKNLPFIR